jgi:hypothetical protein
MTLILSTISLLIGPLIYAAGRNYSVARRIFDALIVLAIAVIIVVHIVPEALRLGGTSAVVVLLLGLAFPMVLERLFKKATDTAHLVVVAIAAFGLLLHAIVDGIALLPANGAALANAVILHRIPVGMALWWAVKPSFGVAVAATMFALIILATAAGYFVGEAAVQIAETKTIAMLQAFVAGSLVHVVLFGVKHHHHH